MTFEDQKVIIGIMKRGQAAVEAQSKKKRPPPPRAKSPKLLDAAYPDYGKSLVARHRKDPQDAGVHRGLEYGGIGGILGALIGTLASDDNKLRNALIGAGGGAIAGGVPGYMSGKHEAESDYSKLLFLRRLGIRSPGELSAVHNFPGVTQKVLAEEGLI